MKTITATEAKNRLGAVMDSALLEPVMIEKSGRNFVVILGAAEYERLVALDDAYWAARAIKGETGGFATRKQVQKLLADASSES